MRKIWGIIFLALLAVAFFNRTTVVASANNLLYQSPCDTPITYHLGSMDPKFNITNQEFLNDVHTSGEIWSKAENKNLFAYKSDGEVTINLIYDQRQFLNSQINQLDSKVKTQQSALAPEIADYKKRAADFRAKAAQLNKDIDYWNSKGGAPPDEYEKLKTRQSTLQQEAAQLQKEAASLNQSTDEYNTQVGQLHQTVDTFNQALQYKPEEGEYIVNHGIQTLNIYFDNSQPELVHTLAHEMGHALGLGHNENPQSIMYPRTTASVTPSGDDLLNLEKVCQKRSVLQTLAGKFQLLLTQIRQKVYN